MLFGMKPVARPRSQIVGLLSHPRQDLGHAYQFSR